MSFDESLSQMVICLDKILPGKVNSGVIVRDAVGKLAFFVNDELSDNQINACSESLRSAVGCYAREDRVLADRNSLGASHILESPDIRMEKIGDRFVKLIDRRIIASDWLLAPNIVEPTPPRLVFSSLKGGVGRSTALAVLAADEARRGRNVLVIDLDLEAPGIGATLLASDRRPKYGVIDYLIESRIQNVSDGFLDEFVGVSGLTTGAGLVDIVPGVGTKGILHPQNFLAKLSRAMLNVDSEGESMPLRERICSMVDRLANRRRYDLVLVDARAGLSELSPGPILGLGATVLLFGTAQDQTLEGYRYLLSHLSSFVSSENKSSWRRKLRMVHAKASFSDEIHNHFTEDLWELFLEYLYDPAEARDITESDAFSFDFRDPDAPHWPLSIPFDPRFVDWNPITRPTDLTSGFYESTFGSFVKAVDDLICLPNALTS